MKLANETITVFHYGWNPEVGDDTWSKSVIEGVSLHGDTATVVAETGLVAASRYTIRIPTADELTITAGDIIVKGTTEAANPNGLDGITVVGVTDNRNGLRGKHWKITGKA